MKLSTIHTQIIKDNAWASKKGWGPIYSAHKDARIAIIGQAPGIRAQESGIPWHDKSGENLRAWLGVGEAEFYDPRLFALIPMDFYFPGAGKSGDLPPRPEFAEKWHPLLFKAMPNITLTILIGAYAQSYYLGDTKHTTLTETVQHYKDYGPNYLPLVHPSPRNNIWQKKNPWFKTDVLPYTWKRVRALVE